MKKSFLTIAAIFMATACLNYTDLDGDPEVPDICCEPYLKQFALPAPIQDFDVAGRGELFAIAWREEADDFSRGWISVTSVTEPENLPLASELEYTADRSIGVWQPQVLWFSHDPIIFYNRFDVDSGSIVMRAFMADSSTLGPAQIMPLHGHVSISRAVRHPSGELAFSWTGWESDGANSRTWFSRLTENGELIESYEVAPEGYAYAPRIQPTADGYAFAYTESEDPDRRQVFSSRWRFADGFSTPVKLNSDAGRFTALDLTASGEINMVLWKISLHQENPHINAAFLSWIGPEGLQDSILLDDIVMGSDVLDCAGEALVSWCSIDSETLEYSLTVARASSGSFSSILHINLGENACDLTRLALLGSNPTVFWTQSGTTTLHYRMLCE